jgi:hypothetical protein
VFEIHRSFLTLASFENFLLGIFFQNYAAPSPPPPTRSTLIKKGKKIFLISKEIQSGAVAVPNI